MIPGVEIQGAPYLIDLMADPEMETLSFNLGFATSLPAAVGSTGVGS